MGILKITQDLKEIKFCCLYPCQRR